MMQGDFGDAEQVGLHDRKRIVICLYLLLGPQVRVTVPRETVEAAD